MGRRSGPESAEQPRGEAADPESAGVGRGWGAVERPTGGGDRCDAERHRVGSGSEAADGGRKDSFLSAALPFAALWAMWRVKNGVVPIAALAAPRKQKDKPGTTDRCSVERVNFVLNLFHFTVFEFRVKHRPPSMD